MKQKTKRSLIILLLALCANFSQNAKGESLAWYFTGENTEEIPIEVELDSAGFISEMWLKDLNKKDATPRSFMEQVIGLKWMGQDPDKEGRPRKVLFVFGRKYFVEISGENVRTAKIDATGEKLLWSDNTKQDLVGYKKRSGHRKRTRSAKKINFGKVTLPPLYAKAKEWPAESYKDFDKLLLKITEGPAANITGEDYQVVQRMSEPQNNLLKFKYNSRCSTQDRASLDKIFVEKIEPELNCWLEQNPERAAVLIGAFLQKPEIECSNSLSSHGKASLPLSEAFFVDHPRVTLNLSKAKENLSDTVLHEVLHIAGVVDGEPMDKAVEQAQSCSASKGTISFKPSESEFFNDLQVETRMLLFRKIREISVEKWGWSEGEKAYALAQLCTRMGDKFCSRRFFQLATESGGSGVFALPEGGEVTFSAAAHFGLFDSITEDLPRMRELARYLARDPNGMLLKRLEADGTHRVHEFFVARSTLEHVKNNKGICNSETDDRVTCEDLSQIVKTPWFKNP